MASRKPKPLNLRDLAAAMNVAENTVTSWVTKGCPVVRKGAPGRAWQFDLGAVRKWHEQWRAGIENRGPNNVVNLTSARERKVQIETQLAEIKLQERIGSLIPIEDVAQIVAAEYANVRSRLTALPGSMATDLEHCTPAEIQEKLAEAIQDVLSELTADDKYASEIKPSGPPSPDSEATA